MVSENRSLTVPGIEPIQRRKSGKRTNEQVWGSDNTMKKGWLVMPPLSS
ncbi:hypothetical protein Z949_3700 [Sulfitobacter guttiformis KCTC 32187]|nr:hypothetical protein Z949_3700 [Sulfitobacter guttiformis KCTC 32187]